MNKQDILNTRLLRHGLLPPVEDDATYVDLFRQLQPVSTLHNTCPGAPPSLAPRAAFEDTRLTSSLRREGALVKGRFLGDGIGYVLANELPLYATAFCKSIPRQTEKHRTILHALRSCGPLTPRQLKEETGLLNKELMPALHRLQKAFLVFEDQVDSDWERSWVLFEDQWPDVVLEESQRSVSACEVLKRFLKSHVFATLEEIRDWSRFPARFTSALLTSMLKADILSVITVTGLGEGYMLKEDQNLSECAQEESIFMLHKADPMVKAHASELKRLFGHEETLQYLLIDGELTGAVIGHWRIGPHDVEDILVLLSDRECKRRRQEILSVVSQTYAEPRSRIRHYNGTPLS